MEKFNHLERKADVLGGKPVIKGTRISVAIILEWLATGATPEAIVDDNPAITLSAINEALLYASKSISATEFIDIPIAA